MRLFGFDINVQRREAVQGVPSSTADTGGTQANGKTSGVHGASYEANIVYARSPQVALSVSAVHRAVELRAKTLAMMLLQYQTKDKIGGNFQQDTSRYGNGLNWLLQVEPNPIMTAASLIEQVIIDRLNRGNGLIYIERDYSGDVVALWRAQYGGYNAINGTYTLTYLTDKGLRSLVNVPKEDVIHLPNTYREVDGVVGISTIRHAYDTLSLIKTQKAQALDTAAKGGRVKGFISEDKQPGQLGLGMYNKNTSNDYAKEISDKIYQQDIVSLRGLEKFQSISMTSADMELVAQLNLGLDDVARFWGTPRPLLMLDTNSHYTSYRDATMEYLQRTIAPDAREIEDEFNRKLLNRYDFGKARIHMCELPLLRMDLESQAKVDQYRLQMGWTINEIRQQYDMPAVKNGDIPYRTANVKPLGEEEAAATELQPGNYKVPAPAPKPEGEDKGENGEA